MQEFLGPDLEQQAQISAVLNKFILFKCYVLLPALDLRFDEFSLTADNDARLELLNQLSLADKEKVVSICEFIFHWAYGYSSSLYYCEDLKARPAVLQHLVASHQVNINCSENVLNDLSLAMMELIVMIFGHYLQGPEFAFITRGILTIVNIDYQDNLSIQLQIDQVLRENSNRKIVFMINQNVRPDNCSNDRHFPES